MIMINECIFCYRCINNTITSQSLSWNRIIVNLYQTLGISVNDKQLVFRSGGDPMDSAPPAFTGQHDITSFGWKESDATINIKQTQPLGMTLISLAGELSVSD